MPHRGLFLLTAGQIRAARAVLAMSLNELAEHCGVSVSTLRRMEAVPYGMPSATVEVIQKLHACFASKGFTFSPWNPDDPASEPGLKWKVPGSAAQQDEPDNGSPMGQ